MLSCRWAAERDRSLMDVIERAHLLRVDASADDGPLVLNDGIKLVCPTLPEGPLFMRVPGNPVPWPRAGNTQGRFYLPKPVAEAQDRMACRFATSMLYEGNVAVTLDFFVQDWRLKDIDNLQKTVLDAASDGGLWRDDSQVTRIVVEVQRDEKDPRTEIGVLGYSNPTLPRGRLQWPVCLNCHERFDVRGRKNVPATCSTECQLAMAPQGALL